MQPKPDQDTGKGATETDDHRSSGNIGLQQQQGHRDQDPLLKDSDSDFPEPASKSRAHWRTNPKVRLSTYPQEGASCEALFYLNAQFPRQRNSSITASKTSLPGRVTESGSVANGSSTTLSISIKFGASG